jgi:hypothetical protein
VPADDNQPLPPGGRPAREPLWDPWEPGQLPGLLTGVTAPWYAAGGWALDLFRGEQTRPHEDLEIGLPHTSEAFGQVRAALAGYEFEVAGSGQLWPADTPAFEIMHQTWVSDAGQPGPDGKQGRIYRLDVFREPQRDGRWVCRRDESIVVPYDWLATTVRRVLPGHPWLDLL